MFQQGAALLPLWASLALANPDFIRELNAITDEITRRYFSGFGCIVYISEEGDSFLPSWTIPTTVMVVALNSIAEDNASEVLLREIYNQDCKGFVIRSWDRLKVTEELIRAYKKSDYSRYNNRRYLFLPRDENDDVRGFLEVKTMFYMPEVAFLAPRDNGTGFDVLGHNYFDGWKYDVLKEKHEVMDVWYPGVGFQRNETLYPDRLANLNGKKMIFAVMHYAPYTLVIKEGGGLEYDGLETRIAAQFAELKNATWMGMDHPIHLWGDLFDNGTGNGIIGSVYEHKADIGFAAIYQWHCDVVECSFPYIYAGVTCLVPKPLPVSGWYTIFLPFEPQVWTGILVTYVLISIFVFLAWSAIDGMRHERYTKGRIIRILDESFFSVFRVQLEQTPHETRVKSPLYAFFKIWTVYCFFVAVCWQGGIASFLTVPRYEKPINDAHDLTARWPSVEWGASHIDWIKSIEQTSEPVLLKIVNDFVILDDETLKKRTTARNFGFFMERLPNGHYGLNDYIDEEGMKYLRIMEDNIYTANCVMILPKCSPYLESLDKMLFWMFDTGLIQKLEIQTSLERINNRLQNMIRTSTEKASEEDVALLVTHIQGAIYIYAFGMTFSGLVFLLEIWYPRRRILGERFPRGNYFNVGNGGRKPIVLW